MICEPTAHESVTSVVVLEMSPQLLEIDDGLHSRQAVGTQKSKEATVWTKIMFYRHWDK